MLKYELKSFFMKILFKVELNCKHVFYYYLHYVTIVKKNSYLFKIKLYLVPKSFCRIRIDYKDYV